MHLPFTESPAGHILIDASVNGVLGKFIFDTGAGLNLLTKQFADTVPNLTKTERLFTGHRATGERLDVALWQAKTLDIGGVVEQQTHFAVLNIDFPIAGLISLMPFRAQPFTLNYLTQTLHIGDDSKHLDKEVGNGLPLLCLDDRGLNFNVFTEVMVNNQLSVLAKLDSGAGRDVFRFNASYLERLEISPTSTRQEKSAFQPNHQNTFYSANLSSLSIPTGQTKTSVNVSFIDGLIYEGIIDNRWLGDIQTYDLARRLVYTSKH